MDHSLFSGGYRNNCTKLYFLTYIIIIFSSFVLLLTAVIIIYLNTSLAASGLLDQTPAEYAWIVHGIFNTLGYSAILVPGYLAYIYFAKANYLDKGSGCLVRLLRKCFGEEETLLISQPLSLSSPPRTPLQDALHLLVYFIGLQVSFLTWGILQEKIMTRVLLLSFQLSVSCNINLL